MANIGEVNARNSSTSATALEARKVKEDSDRKSIEKVLPDKESAPKERLDTGKKVNIPA